MAPRRRSPPRITVLWPAVVILLVLLGAGGAAAGSLDDPHVGGVGFGGPTTGDLAAVYWNPGALGMLTGIQLTLSLSEERTASTVQRAAIDPATGLPAAGGLAGPGATRSFLPVTGRGRRSSFAWPPGPGTFLAVGGSIAGRFSVALAAYTPFADHTTFAATADGQQPARYHLVEADLRHVVVATGLAFRLGNELSVGVAPGLLLSTARLVFDEDSALDGRGCVGACVEDPAAAARYSVGSDLGPFHGTIGFTLTGGLHFRRGRLELGLAYAAHSIGNTGAISVAAPHTDVTPPPVLGAGQSLCPTDHPAPCMFGRIAYDLPDIMTAGVTWHATPRLAVTGVLRLLTFGRHRRIDVRVVAPPAVDLRGLNLPDAIALYRGFRDVFEARLRVEHSLRGWLKVGAALRADNGSVGAASLAPGATSGPTLEPALMAELRASSWLQLTAGYALAITPARDTGTSVFDPGAALRCAQAQGDLGTADCTKRLAGAARPTAAGRYSAIQHSASLAATVRF